MAMKQADTPGRRHIFAVDIRQDLPKVKCPVLAMNGKKDMQVDCEKNISALQEGLRNCKPKIVAFDGLNHLFQHCPTGNLVEYQQIVETISIDVLKAIVDFILK